MTRLSVLPHWMRTIVLFCEDVHTTEYYHELREETDDSILVCQYMQEPIEAIGLLFPKSELNRFKLADIEGKQPDGVIGATDVADEGDDDFCAPIAKSIRYKVFHYRCPVYERQCRGLPEPKLVSLILLTPAATICVSKAITAAVCLL